MSPNKQIIDLTVIIDRYSSTGRAYLIYLARAHFVPRKILLVDFLERSFVARWIRKNLNTQLVCRLQRIDEHRRFMMRRKFKHYCRAVQEPLAFAIDYFEPFDFSKYGEACKEIAGLDYDDAEFQQHLRQETCKTFLFTGGFRVPRVLLDDPALRFIHVHPGILPSIRGMDGLLWSLALHGCPGASCFYLDSGIDTGKVIATKQFAAPRFNLPLSALHDPTLYEALLFAFDPHLRAELLVDILRQHAGENLAQLPCKSQQDSGERTYFAMHPQLQKKVLTAYFSQTAK